MAQNVTLERVSAVVVLAAGVGRDDLKSQTLLEQTPDLLLRDMSPDPVARTAIRTLAASGDQLPVDSSLPVGDVEDSDAVVVVAVRRSGVEVVAIEAQVFDELRRQLDPDCEAHDLGSVHCDEVVAHDSVRIAFEERLEKPLCRHRIVRHAAFPRKAPGRFRHSANQEILEFQDAFTHEVMRHSRDCDLTRCGHFVLPGGMS